MKFGHTLRRMKPERLRKFQPVFAMILVFLMALSLFGRALADELDPTEFIAGSILTDEEACTALADPGPWFYEEKINDEVFARIDGKTYPEDCPIPLDELRYLKVLHYNFDHELQVGELIVNTDLSETLLEIFRALFDVEYEIYSMYLPEEFWAGDASATDTASIAANNTSAFCYRVTQMSGNLSNHASGRAIDINPLQNPYIEIGPDGNVVCDQEESLPYLDRSAGYAHMITVDDPCYQLFSDNGFTWGGSWSNPIDYQHFERTW